MGKALHAGFRWLPALLLLGGCERERDAEAELRSRGWNRADEAARVAVEREDPELLALALRATTGPLPTGPDGWAPLHRAILRGRPDLAGRLIGSGANPNRTGAGGIPPLALAIEAGLSETAILLLEQGADPDRGRMRDGSPLGAGALRHGQPGLSRRLLEAGADPDQLLPDGRSWLRLAIEEGERELVGTLLERGAEPADGFPGMPLLASLVEGGWRSEAARASERLTPEQRREVFGWVLEGGRLELAAELATLGLRPEPQHLDRELVMAVDRGDRAGCRILLGLGARVRVDPSRCLVRTAAIADRAAMLHLLMSYRRPPAGALDASCRRGDRDLAGLMLAHGADPNPAGAPFLDSALTAAIEAGDRRLAVRLTRAGAWSHTVGRRGQSALALAIVHGHHEVLREMLEQGADPNRTLRAPVHDSFRGLVRGKNLTWLMERDAGLTPLMLAVDTGSLDAAALLIEHGARINVRTRRESIWPINIAAWHGDVPMMRLLLGVDPHGEERFLRVDLSEQRLRVVDRSGGELFSTRISSGRRGFETATGEFVVTNRHRNWTSTIYDASMPYFLRLNCGDFGFHGGNVPGYPASHGCLRVPHGQAAKLFRLVRLGDRVRIDP